MSLVNQTLPGLYGGVSQQSPELRHDTQVTEMINCYPSVVGGLQKRPSSIDVYNGDNTTGPDYIPSDAFIYSYDRGAGNEQYLIVIRSDGYYRFFDLITKDWITQDWTFHQYLTIPDGKVAKDSFTLSTVGDTTFVVNRTKVCAMSDTVYDNDDLNWEKNFYYWVKRTNGDAGDNASLRYTYYIRSNDPNYTGTSTASSSNANLTDSTASFPTTLAGLTLHNITKGWSAVITASTSTTITTAINNQVFDIGDSYEIVVQVTHHDSNKAALQLAKQINGIGDPNYSATAKGSVLKVEQTNGYNLTGSDSWGNQASESWQGKIKKLQALPNELGFENTVVEITGDDDTAFDSYYVKYVDGVYKETYRPGITRAFDATTMPHKIELRRLTEAPTYFTNFSEIEWKAREVGDDTTASEPSFIGNTIQDVFFYRNRLGFLSVDNVLLSESGEYYNYFPTTVTSVIDSDPIDVAVDSNKAISLRYATPFNKELLIFGDKAQFVMSASDTLTPTNVSVQQSTAFDIKDVKPVVAGPNAYFAIEKDDWSAIREYYVQPDSLSNDAADITAHCPAYIPKGITNLVASSKNDMLFALSSFTPDTLYVYNYYWNGEEKAQSAWHKWQFAGAVIYDIKEVAGTLYLFTNRGTQSYIEKVPLGIRVNTAGIIYEDISLGTENSGININSLVELTEVGFPTGNTKIDDKRNKFMLKNIQINADYGSFYNMEVFKYIIPKKYGYTVGSGIYPNKDLLPSHSLIPLVSSYDMTTDGKYPVNGKADKLTIKIHNDLLVGFKINSINLQGNLVQQSRSL